MAGEVGLSEVVLQVLYGVREDEPLCYLLKVGPASILLDCGWDVRLNESVLQPHIPVFKTIGLVLISSPDLAHMGALPWVFKHLPPHTKVYSTHPVQKLGQMILYDLHQSKCMETGSCSAFTLDDIDSAIQRFKLLKFYESLEVRLQGRAFLSITPYPAGRVLGAAMWRIKWRNTEDILYAVDFNIKNERHLVGAVEALNTLSADKEQRPALVITDARNALSLPSDERKTEAEFLDAVTSTLRMGGNVLVPVEASGRVQELLLLLNAHWKSDKGLHGYKIVLLHHMARNVLHFTRSMVEWMHPDVIADFDRTLRNPFTLKHVVAAQSMVELEAAAGEYNQPMVVCASDDGMDCGFSRALATLWASKQTNALVLVGQPKRGTLAESFYRLRHLPAAALSFSVPVIEKIVGEELVALREQAERDRRKAMEQEEFRRQADELVQGTVGVLLTDGPTVLHKISSMGDEGATTPVSAAVPPVKRRRRTLASYRRPLFLTFGCRDPQEGMVDEYGIALAEGECMDRTKAAMQEQRGLLQGLGVGVAAARGAQRWGYLDGLLMTEAEAQVRTGTAALKFTLKESAVDVRWRVKAFNLEGRTDGKNMRAVLTRLSPRTLILVHGSHEAMTDMRKHATKRTTEVSAVERGGEVVQMTLDTLVYDVALGHGFSQVSTKALGSYSLAHVKAVAGDVQTGEGLTLLKSQPLGPRQPMLLCEGEVLVTDATLRKQLKDAGVVPELRIRQEGRASLVCDGTVVVKVEGSTVSLEGPLSEAYFKVRNVLYDRFVAL